MLGADVLTQQALIRLVVLQFSVYSVLGILGFLAWLLAFTDNLAILGVLVGGYVRGHLVRWTAQFPSWGAFILLSGAFSLAAAWSLWRMRKEGLCFAVLSFSVGFLTNMVFAQNLIVHSLLGILIGWILLAPLSVAWKSLK